MLNYLPLAYYICEIEGSWKQTELKDEGSFQAVKD